MRRLFYCLLLDQPYPGTGVMQLASNIQIEVPDGLTNQQAIDYVTGRIAEQVGHYAAHEALNL